MKINGELKSQNKVSRPASVGEQERRLQYNEILVFNGFRLAIHLDGS